MDISRTMGSVSEDPVELSAQIRIGADLITSSQQHLEFLKTVHSHPSLYGGLVLQRAIRRYVQFWLPLAAEYKEETLAAPLDIEWVWHCHMLSPTLYHTDLMKLCGTIIRHKVSDKRNYEQALAFSETYWKRKYPEQPFQVSLDTLVDVTESGSQEGEVSRSLGLQYDLEAAAGRQKAFYYQVSLPHYEDEKFLLGALKRYKKFLYLKQLTPNTFLVPCYDIDLMWHTHMNFPRIYKEDTTALLGKTLNHDDSVNDRTPGSKLDRTTMNTRVLWKRTYNEKFSNFGAMYRGGSQSPEANLYQIADCEKFALFSKNTKISFDRIHLNERDKASKKFKLQIIEKDNIVIANKGSRSDIVDCSDALLTLKGPPCGWENAGSILKKLNCIGSNNIYIEVKPCKSLFGLSNSKKSKKLEAKIDLETISHKLTCLKKPVTERAQLELDNKERVTLDMTLTPESLGGCTLWLYPGLFKDCVMPVESEQLWGPVMLPKLPPNVENKCSVASHKLQNYKGKVVFTCRMIHSIPLMMSVVQVFYHDKMAAVAHLIGSDQIPKPEQIDNLEKSVTLDPKKGERAILIKNSEGDWGILVARWDGMRRGIPGKSGTKNNPGKPGQPGHPGYMNLLFYKVKTKTWQIVSLEESYGTEDFHLKICDTNADLKRGQINIRAGSGEVAENLALVFSVCLLHVFLQPRPANWEPGESLVPEQRFRSRGNRRVRHINAESVALIMAAGLLMATPSNHFIRKRMKDSHMAGGFARGGALGDREDNEGEGVQVVTQDASDSVFGEGGFGGGGVKQDDGPEPHEIITDLFGGGEDEQADEQIENNFEEMENDEMNEMVENLTGEDENIDMYGETEIDNYNDMYGDLGTDHDVYGEDFNTFLGDIDTGTTEGVGDNDGGGWVGLGNDGDGGGCGGCGGGGGFGGDLGGGGGDSGGGGGIFGGGFSGGAFGDSGGDGGGDGGATGGGGGWLDGFSGMDSGGGDGGGGGWGDGGGGVDGGGGGGGDGGGGGCGGGCGG